MRYLLFVLAVLMSLSSVFGADVVPTDPLLAVQNQADIDSLIATTNDATKKKAIQVHQKEILAAAARRKHVLRVIEVLDQARGTFEKCNDTLPDLANAMGGPSSLFDSLRIVNLSSADLGVKSKRATDPFDQGFYEHLGHIDTLEDLIIIHTAAQDDWLAPLGKLASLKSLRIVNQPKLTDAGLAHLAGLSQLETFSYIGTKMTGASFKDFHGWANLKRSSFRGSNMSEAGLIYLCDAFPNLESLVLAHGHYTDAAVAHVAKLTKLTSLEIGSKESTPACLKSIVGLPLEYLQTGAEFNVSEVVAIIKDMSTIKRLALTYCPAISDDDLRIVTSMTHLENLELGNIDLPAERLPLMAKFKFLKSLKTTRPRQPHDSETQAKLKALIPDVLLSFQ